MKKIINPVWAILPLLPLLLGITTLRDPTRPPDIIFSPQHYNMDQPLQLTAVFTYPTYRFAIINDQIVKPGDHISEFTITTINPYTVELIGTSGNQEVLQLITQVKQAIQQKGR